VGHLRHRQLLALARLQDPGSDSVRAVPAPVRVVRNSLGRARRRAGGWSTPLLVVSGTLITTAALLGRQRAVSAWDTVWAEDGSVFLADALERPLSTTLVQPHGGYLHLPPRLAAATAASLPLEWAAIVLSLAWAFVVALLATFVYFASASVLRARTTRVALSMLVALLPAAGSELLGNTINLHFYLVFACFWAFVWRSDAPVALAARSVVAGAAALSDPVSAVLVPVALWSALSRRRRRALVVPAVFALGLIAQLAAIAATDGGPQRLTRFDPGSLPLLFALRVAGSLVVGDRFLDELWLTFGAAFAYAALAAVVIALVVQARGVTRRTRAFVAVCAAYAPVLFGLYLFGRGSGGMRPGVSEETWHLAGARFTYAPILFLAAALLTVADRRLAGVANGTRLRGEVVAVALVTALVAANFAFQSERSLGPTWGAELAAARGRCASGQDEARLLVAPAPFEFRLIAKCSRLGYSPQP
jgi:hypothetical protein